MVEYAGNSYLTVCPHIYYEDCAGALEWLTRAFGFRERMRSSDDQGTISHCEMTYADAVIMMGTPPHHEAPVNPVTVGLYVHVGDVDAHYEQALQAGVNVEGPPENQAYGVRQYGARDLEGHQWWFSTPRSN
ncbi:MAG: VOC family protein [Acidimicrobiales bacterium]